MEVVFGYMNRCKCGNLYLPSGRSMCPPCRQKVKEIKWHRLALAREARRKAKHDSRSEAKHAAKYAK